MRNKLFFAILVCFFAVTSGQTAPVPAPQQNPSAAPQPPAPNTPPPSAPLKSNTRLVTVDVVATDSHGNAVRGLKPEDFEVSDNGRQKIEQFAFIDESGSSTPKLASAGQPRPKGFYTNQAAINTLATPPTVVLMDSLNTDIQDLVQTRRYMLHLLKTLPPDAPVAVFLLGQSLRVVQGFTSDPALLRAAVDKAMSPSPTLDLAPEDDPNSASLAVFDANGGQEDDVSATLEDFEKETYASTMDIRVDTTLEALTTIAHYLSGFRGRKNLIWVSESFPLVLWPDPDFGTNSGAFRGTRSYGGQVEDAANALTDAQVAVYPVDARGLQGSQLFSAAQQPVNRPNSPVRSLPAQLNRENTARTMSQNSMDELAQDTGGKTCKNTNDLSGCVEAALKDSSSYYEVAYYPQNAKWDGSFHKISLKTTRPGIKLTYRRGYFAQDAETLSKKQTPEKRLQQTCRDLLPSTGIPITAQAVPPLKPDEARYLMSVTPGALSLAPDGESHELNAEMATCSYGAKGRPLQFFMRDISQTVSSALYQSWQASGVHGYVDVPKAGTDRLRIVVLDLGTGLTGALDIPMRPADFGEPAAQSSSSASTASANSSPPAAPAAASPGPSQQMVTVSITFKGSSGQSSVLDWTGDTLSYRGDLAVVFGAPAFFQKLLGADFHCQAGSLVPNDARSTATPKLIFQFMNSSGHSAIVDLTGSEAQYSGSLPVDPSVKPFFELVRKMSHCTQP